MALALTTREVVDSLAGHVALLDADGTIVTVNEQWRHFAAQNGGHRGGYLDANYLEVCRDAVAAGSEDARHTLKGLREVLDKKRLKFQLEYPCHSPTQQRWFEMHVTPLEQGALVEHSEVTAHRRSEAILAASERRLRAVLGGLNTALYVVDARARVRFFNQAAAAMARHFQNREVSLDMPFSELVPGPFRPLFHASFRRALSGTAVHHERSVAGTWFRVSYQPIVERGRVHEVCLSFEDVTARKRAEAAKRRREGGGARYDALPIAAVTWDGAHRITGWNPAAERMFGYRADGVVGVKNAAFLFEHAPTHAEALLTGTSTKVVTVTHTNLTEAGQLRELTCDWVSAPLEDDAGGALGTVAFAADAGERGRLRSALRALEAQFARVLRHSPLPTLIVARAGDDVLDANRSFLETSDYALDDLVGRKLADLNLFPHLAAEVASLPGQSSEHLLRTKGGAWRTVLVSAAEVAYKDVPCWLLNCVDITQRRRSEEDLLRAFREAMQEADWFGHAVLEKLAQRRPTDPDSDPGTDFRIATTLTRREREVLSLMAEGRVNEDIAAALGISHQTVRNYVTRIYDKLDLHSRAEAVVWARERGLTFR